MKPPQPSHYLHDNDREDATWLAWQDSNSLLIKSVGHIERTVELLKQPTEDNLKTINHALTEFLKSIEK